MLLFEKKIIFKQFFTDYILKTKLMWSWENMLLLFYLVGTPHYIRNICIYFINIVSVITQQVLGMLPIQILSGYPYNVEEWEPNTCRYPSGDSPVCWTCQEQALPLLLSLPRQQKWCRQHL